MRRYRPENCILSYCFRRLPTCLEKYKVHWNPVLRVYSHRKWNFEDFRSVLMGVSFRKCSFVPILCLMLFFNVWSVTSTHHIYIQNRKLGVRARMWAIIHRRISCTWFEICILFESSVVLRFTIGVDARFFLWFVVWDWFFLRRTELNVGMDGGWVCVCMVVCFQPRWIATNWEFLGGGFG